MKMLQCKKAFFLSSAIKKEGSNVNTAHNIYQDNGMLVGKLGQQLYKGGVDLSENGRLRGLSLVNKTHTEIAKGSSEIYYEAAFMSPGNLLFQADVILLGKNVNRIVEFKSGTYIKKPGYIFDIGFQKRVLIDAGFDKKLKIFIAHINPHYNRGNGIELDKLFIHHNLTEAAHRVQPLILRQLDEMQEIISRGMEPNIKVGNHCVNPAVCQFYSRCWSNISATSIIHATTLKKWQKDRLNQLDVKTIREIPSDMKFNSIQWSEVKSILKHQVEINKKDVKKFLARIKPPFSYLSFESVISPIPLYNNTTPYTQLPTQFTLLTKSQEGKYYKKEFVANAGEDPRQQFVEHLIANVSEQGSVIVYNKAEELNKLQATFPELSNIISSVIDLVDLFKNKHYWHSSFRGRFTLQDILSVLCPDISYSNLNIQNEATAMKSYIKLSSCSIEECKETLRALKKYSLMNAYSIVKIHEALLKV